jgi:hypothetical protein
LKENGCLTSADVSGKSDVLDGKFPNIFLNTSIEKLEFIIYRKALAF